MKCIRPFTKIGQAYGCGQCLPCRVQKRRLWRSRIMIEAMQYTDNAFVTLTYNDKSLPVIDAPDGLSGAGTLEPAHLRNFLKRLRKELPNEIRFFAVGEYGGETWRPHYHLALFNFSNCARGLTLQSPLSSRRLASKCCSQCSMVERIWGNGDIELRALDPGKSGYLAGYVTKKMTKKEDARLLGRHPEFSRQSNGGGKSKFKGGIGAPGLDAMAKIIRQYTDPKNLIDVPTHLLHEKKQLVLGRYLRKKLRQRLELKEETPLDVQQEIWAATMRPVLRYTQINKEGVVSLKEAFALLNAPYAEKLEAQMKQNLRGKL